MNDMIDTRMQTPIEIALGVDENGMTTAKKLYAFLELNPGNFARWCKSNITENEFAEENIDFVRFFIDEETPTGGKIQREDYKLTAHFAKKLSVKGNSARAEEAREYFTRLEEKAKQHVIDRTKLSQETRALMGLIESIAKTELEQKRQAEQIQRLEDKQKAITDTFQRSPENENFQVWANKCLSRIAEHPKFRRNYGAVKNESYERLKRRWNCNLNVRVERAKGRALERNPGITKAELNSINKLTVIANDKSLRPIYETVIKEMMIAYCVN